jgi:hypothetical protein
VSHRLDPQELFDDAAALLAHNADPQRLVADLLKTIRQQDNRLNAIHDSYSHNDKVAWERVDVAEKERNEYREALRVVKRAVRDIRLGRD